MKISDYTRHFDPFVVSDLCKRAIEAFENDPSSISKFTLKVSASVPAYAIFREALYAKDLFYLQDDSIRLTLRIDKWEKDEQTEAKFTFIIVEVYLKNAEF